MGKRRQTKKGSTAKEEDPDMKLRKTAYLKDFKVQVLTAENEMRDAKDTLVKMVKQIYERELCTIPRHIAEAPFIKFMEGGPVTQPTTSRTSIENLLSSADDILNQKANKRKNKKAVPKSTRPTRQKKVLVESQADNIPATVSRGRPKNNIMATPANTQPPNIAQLFITPKFDPRTPLPPSTIKRAPKMNEIAISLSGSPLQVAHHPSEWLQQIDKNQFDAKLQKKINDFQIFFKEHFPPE